MQGVAGLVLLLGLFSFTPACGGDDGPHAFVARITSHQPSDGDVVFDPASGTRTVTPATNDQRLIYGVDSAVESLPEYRAFLRFPLDGSTGEGIVPPRGRVVVSTLELFIQRTDFASTVPTLIELLPYPATGPREVDFGSEAISAVGFEVYASDAGVLLDLDVTVLVEDALVRGLRDFQVRLGLEPPARQGLVQIADGTASEAPFLQVEYTGG